MDLDGTNDFSPILTPRLVLRRLAAEDAETLFTYRSDARVSRYQSWRPKNLGEIQVFIARQLELAPDTPGTWFQLAISDRQSSTMIGDCGLHFIDDTTVEIGFTISPDYQGRGAATETVMALLKYLFSNLKKHRVTASADPRNISSVRVLDRVGMRKEAHFIKSFRMDGEWADDVIYALLAEDWEGGC